MIITTGNVGYFMPYIAKWLNIMYSKQSIFSFSHAPKTKPFTRILLLLLLFILCIWYKFVHTSDEILLLCLVLSHVRRKMSDRLFVSFFRQNTKIIFDRIQCDRKHIIWIDFHSFSSFFLLFYNLNIFHRILYDANARTKRNQQQQQFDGTYIGQCCR